jgi:hypothetical protein
MISIPCPIGLKASIFLRAQLSVANTSFVLKRHSSSGRALLRAKAEAGFNSCFPASTSLSILLVKPLRIFYQLPLLISAPGALKWTSNDKNSHARFLIKNHLFCKIRQLCLRNCLQRLRLKKLYSLTLHSVRGLKTGVTFSRVTTCSFLTNYHEPFRVQKARAFVAHSPVPGIPLSKRFSWI